MKIKALLALMLTFALMLGAGALAAGGGSASDPLISLSYLTQIFTAPQERAMDDRLSALVDDSLARLDSGLDAAQLTDGLDDALADELTRRVTQRVAQRMTARNFTEITAKKGDLITGPVGAGIILKSGSGTIAGTQLLNLTVGVARPAGYQTANNVYYLVADNDNSGIRITSSTATVLVGDGAAVWVPYAPHYTELAERLKTLRIFRGSDKGFELERKPNRQEALILLIRLMGEDAAAVAYTKPSTFGDVTGWATGQRYIAYGQYRGYTNGSGRGPDGKLQFLQRDDASLEMYLTFVLRALGYSDKAGDFVWNKTSRSLAVSLGLLTDSDLRSIDRTGFYRDHVVLISYNALWVRLKGSASTLGDKLVENGAITRSALDAARK